MSSSSSPRIAPADIVLDNADPFSFLLSDDPWPEPDFSAQMKPYAPIDFTDISSLSMDMDYINTFAVEPSALQFVQPPPYLDGLSPAFQVHHHPSSPSDSSSSSAGRRLSISSMSSSSPAPSPAAAAPAPDAATLIAERVRQSAGVMLALPMSAHIQAFGSPHEHDPKPPTTIPKLPIPRLPRPTPNSLSTSAASTPPPSTPSPSPPTLAPPAPTGANAAGTPSPAQPRAKTSHTTIERRYRTNLNARIQSLRMAVPALRVVDDRDATKKRAPNKVLVSCDPLRTGAGAGEYVVDERGFVDGVRVARKCSKANVLGKAVEYIRVLKRREARLRNEQAGLRSLVAGLVGGPALLREWEREWRGVFGGEERDEVDGEAEGEAEGEDDDDEEEEEDEEEGARKRKRGKVTPVKDKAEKKDKEKKPAVATAVAPDGTVPEKRKRGRPRKVVAPLVVPALPTDPHAQSQPYPQQQQQQPHPQAQGQAQQYLLATFALFSFFNSPLTSFSSSSSGVHGHTGSVLTGSSSGNGSGSGGVGVGVGVGVVGTGGAGAGWEVGYWMHVFHLFVSVVVLVSCVSSWTGVGLGSGGGGVRALIFGKSRSGSLFAVFTRKDKEKNAETQTQIRTKTRTHADWVRLAESYVLARARAPPQQQQQHQHQHQHQHTPSLLARLQAYHHLTSPSGANSNSLSDLCTAALTLHGTPGALGALARARARAVWRACAGALNGTGGGQGKTYERLVFGEGVDEAVGRLARVVEADAGVYAGGGGGGGGNKEGNKEGEEGEEERQTPIRVLATSIVRERVRVHLGVIFVAGVRRRQRECGGQGQGERESESESEREGEKEFECEREKEKEREHELVERQRTVDAARELGGAVGVLGRRLEVLWKVPRGAGEGGGGGAFGFGFGFGGAGAAEDGEEDGDGEEEGEEEGEGEGDGVEALVDAVVLYRRVFAAPGAGAGAGEVERERERERDVRRLRRALGSRVFEESAALEDARDRAVDGVVELARRCARAA
ncbi:hypothetical protein C0992_010191 [Termitomyces sp. T32_za158]|nr:hypothetical protein C0992_010191 [Termitomyces sp. T32_za158]